MIGRRACLESSGGDCNKSLTNKDFTNKTKHKTNILYKNMIS